MTSNHYFNDSSEWLGTVQPFDRPRVIRTEYFFGLDLGQVHDPCAIAGLEYSEISVGRNLVTYKLLLERRLAFRHLERLPLDLDYPTIVERVGGRIASPQLRGSPITLVADATGVGRPVVDLLRRARLPCRLIPVTITGGDRETYESGHWRVPKRDLITGLLVLMQRGKIDICGHLPESEALVSELLNIRIKVSPEGHDTYGAWGEGEHDDLVVAAALACWRATHKIQ